MKTWEALKAMEDGKKVYRRGWKNNTIVKSKYWFMSGQEMFNNELIRASIDNCYFDDWEIYEEEDLIKTDEVCKKCKDKHMLKDAFNKYFEE